MPRKSLTSGTLNEITMRKRYNLLKSNRALTTCSPGQFVRDCGLRSEGATRRPGDEPGLFLGVRLRRGHCDAQR